MYVVYGTRKFLDRVGSPSAAAPTPTTVLGGWYATALMWRPQLALFVNERTLVPVLLPLAPAKEVVGRLRTTLEIILRAHDVPPAFIEAELAAMVEYQLAKTANRSLVGMLNEFAFLAEIFSEQRADIDLVQLSVRLAHTPCDHSVPGAASPTVSWRLSWLRR